MPEQFTSADDIADGIENMAENAGRCARKLFEEAPNVKEGMDSAIHAIREKPIQSALIAFGIGLFVGLLINRR